MALKTSAGLSAQLSVWGRSAMITSRKLCQAGLTLLEILVALGLGAFMLVGLITLVVSVSQSRVELGRTSANVENGRYALQLIGDDIARAGFYGRFSLRSVGNNYAWPDPGICETVTGNLGFSAATPQVPLPVYAETSNPLPACLTNATAGTRALVLRRVATTQRDIVANPIPAGNEHPFLQVSGCENDARVFVFSKTQADLTYRLSDCVTRAPAWSYIARAYYLSPCNDCANGGDGIPTLRSAELTGNTISVLPQVEGIEDMHILYGLDTEANGSPSCYIEDPEVAPPVGSGCDGWGADAEERWRNVVAVRVNLLVRSIEPSPGWTDAPRTYDLGRAARVGPFNDSFKRRVFSSVVVIPNVAGTRL